MRLSINSFLPLKSNDRTVSKDCNSIDAKQQSVKYLCCLLMDEREYVVNAKSAYVYNIAQKVALRLLV